MPLALGLLFLVNTNSPFFTVPVHAQDLGTEAQIEWVHALHLCENRNDVPRILDTNGKYSYGYVMFQMQTWLHFGKDFGATKANINDDFLQKQVALDMLKKGLWRHWYNCSNKLTKTLGAFPVGT